MGPRWSKTSGRYWHRVSRRVVQLRAGLDAQYEEAEDLVQETYVRALQAMERVRAGSNMKSWLFTILRNVWFNQLRKLRNGPQMIEIDVGDGVFGNIVEPSKNSHDLYVSKMETEQVRASIQELPIPFREIILLREYEELSYQIEGVLDWSCRNSNVTFGESTRKTSRVAFRNVGEVGFALSERLK